jgi:hypothetical protein
MWIFEEKQQLSGFWWIIILIVVISLASIFIPYLIDNSNAEIITQIIWITVIVDLLVIIMITKIFRFLIIKADDSELRFGFPPFVVKIPYGQIQSATLLKYNFWQAGGIGIRFRKGRRWNYIAKIGYAVEINWGGKKKHAFSISNHEELSKVLSDFLREKFKKMPEFLSNNS